MMDYVMSIDQRSTETPYFITLTYPGMFPAHGPEWKRQFAAFIMRLRRRWPSAGAVWKLEPQERLAPHYHLLLFGVAEEVDVEEVRDWVHHAWYDVVGSGDVRHLCRGADVQRVVVWEGVACYTSKYLGKEVAAGKLPAWWRGAGKWWGKFNESAIPRFLVKEQWPWEQSYRLRRVLRKWIEVQQRRQQGGRKPRRLGGRRGAGITAYLPEDAARRVLRWAMGRE